jgi:hypothetical protein
VCADEPAVLDEAPDVRVDIITPGGRLRGDVRDLSLPFAHLSLDDVRAHRRRLVDVRSGLFDRPILKQLEADVRRRPENEADETQCDNEPVA